MRQRIVLFPALSLAALPIFIFLGFWGSLGVALGQTEQDPVVAPTHTEPQTEPSIHVDEPSLQEAPPAESAAAPSEEWIQLFNGVDMTGWTAKIRGHEYGDNYANTFRVVDGLLTVCYDQYVDSDFESIDGTHKPTFDKFGHLFYKDTFSHYLLRVEYRFIGTQVKNGPSWALRNNGMMIHGQDPAKMDLLQPFPASIEAQLLGGLSDGNPRPTLNLCTPGTHVVMDGKLFKTHCVNSTSPTFDGEQWVTAEIEVRGSERIKHIINGQVVLEYTETQYDDSDRQTPQAAGMIIDGNKLIDHGTISIQSESHPTQFRKIELKKLPPPKK